MPPRNRRVEVVPYDPEWAEIFARESAIVAEVLDDALLAVYHVGSTSVPGLAAKPTVDMLAVVERLPDVDAANERFIAAGYQPRGEFGIRGRRFFVKGTRVVRVCHLHAFEQGHPEIDRHRAFCAYLAEHPDQAARYGEVKLSLARRYRYRAGSYSEGKTAIIAEIDARAAAWWSGPAASEPHATTGPSRRVSPSRDEP